MSAPFKSVTVPVDLSETSQVCVDFVLANAPSGTILHFCGIVDEAGSFYGDALGAGEPFPLHETLETDALRACEAAVRRAQERGFAADGNVAHGSAPAAIDRFVRANESEAIVICTYARVGISRGVSGTFVEELFELTDVPVIVLHADDDVRGDGAVCVAFDGSGAATRALHAAIDAARSSALPLAIVAVAETFSDLPSTTGILDGAATIAGNAGIAFELVGVEGLVAEAIVEAARLRRSPLLYIGTHGRLAFQRSYIGSVAVSVVERSRIPVIVVQYR